MSVDCCDRALVLRAQSGERPAFNALVRKYRHRVMKLSMRYIRNRADAEDAVHAGHVDGDAAAGGVDVALKRGACAEGDDGEAELGADGGDAADFLRGLWEADEVREAGSAPDRRISDRFWASSCVKLPKMRRK